MPARCLCVLYSLRIPNPTQKKDAGAGEGGAGTNPKEHHPEKSTNRDTLSTKVVQNRSISKTWGGSSVEEKPNEATLAAYFPTTSDTSLYVSCVLINGVVLESLPVELLFDVVAGLRNRKRLPNNVSRAVEALLAYLETDSSVRRISNSSQENQVTN